MSQLVPISEVTDPTEAFGRMTEQQRAWCDAYRMSHNASEAYRVAYSAQNMSPPAIWAEATRIKAHPLVALWLGDQVAQARQIAQDHAAGNILRLENLAALADEPDDASAAKLAVAERAIARSLEAAAVLSQGAAIHIEIGTQRIDAAAAERWAASGGAAWNSRPPSEPTLGDA